MKKMLEHVSIGQNKLPENLSRLWLEKQLQLIVLRIVIVLKCFTFVCYPISVVVEVIKFAMVKINKSCKYQLTTEWFAYSVEKVATILVIETEHWTNLSAGKFKDISKGVSKKFSSLISWIQFRWWKLWTLTSLIKSFAKLAQIVDCRVVNKDLLGSEDF